MTCLMEHEAQHTWDSKEEIERMELKTTYFSVIHLVVLSLHQIIASNDWTMVNDEFERMCTTVLMAYFKVQHWHLPG